MEGNLQAFRYLFFRYDLPLFLKSRWYMVHFSSSLNADIYNKVLFSLLIFRIKNNIEIANLVVDSPVFWLC